MKRNQLTWIIAVAALILAAVTLLAATTKTTTLPCPPGAWCGQEPPAGPVFTTDGDPESEAALAEIREVLMRRGCQIAVVERVNEDGTRTPKLQVERVMYVIAMPDRKR
jgi:hypothetical protein